MTGVRLEHVTKLFKTTPAVEDVSFAVKDGEFVVILGASGSGKSTILRIIAGLEVQTSGHVYIGDMLVDDYEPRDRNIAMVFQSYALYPHLRVYDNIAFALRVRKIPREDDPDRYRHRTRTEIDDRVRRAADLLGIGDTLTKRPSELSGGQRQRVALARAIVRDPELFLLDEPLSNLDAKIRQSARIELKRIHEQLKQTFLFVTHDQSEAMTLADRLVVVDHGHLLQYDTPENVLQHPANQFVASFVGSPEMMFLEGELRAANGGYAFVLETLQIPVRGATAPGPVTIGFRPWDLSVDRGVAPGARPAVVRAVERLGSSDLLFLDLAGTGVPGSAAPTAITLRAMSRSYEYQAGDSVGVTIAADRALFFGPDGARLDALEGVPTAG